MAHRRTSEPAVRPVIWEQLKSQCRITDDQEQIYGEQLLDAATQWVEEYTQRALITQTWALTMDGFYDCSYVTEDVIYVPRPPLLAVSTIVYLDANGTSTTLASTQYRVATASHPGRIEQAYGTLWPTTRGVIGDVVITHTAGYGAAASSVPVAIKQAIMLLAAYWFVQREAVGSMNSEVEFSVSSLLSRYTMEMYA